uniref:Gag1-like clamp domain-containing protein n=1 Tax=Cajanus cajan TaxID=3821 RepID=A0A151RLG1_CAJCA|nr:hypothetical protein KK1_035138 [Cajanus cajan]
MHICGYVPPWLCQIFACMGGCLGCFPNPPLIKGQAMNRDISEDFWSSSAFEIDQTAFQSQKSFSSIGIPSDPQSSAGIQIDSPEYVNHGKFSVLVNLSIILVSLIHYQRVLVIIYHLGLLLWNQMRKQWVGNRRPGNKKQVGEPRISWNATYESLMGTTKPFPQPIPLGEMVEFLVDIWELEGLYD